MNDDVVVTIVDRYDTQIVNDDDDDVNVADSAVVVKEIIVYIVVPIFVA